MYPIWGSSRSCYGSQEYSESLNEIPLERSDGILDKHVEVREVASGSYCRLLPGQRQFRLWLLFRQEETISKFEVGVLEEVSRAEKAVKVLVREAVLPVISCCSQGCRDWLKPYLEAE